MLLEGLYLPLTTPFYSDGRLNLRKLEYNVGRYSKTPVAGLVVLSRVGEAGLLSDAETRDVLASAIGAAAKTRVMIAGVSRPSVMGTLDLADAAAKLGYDAVLIARPQMLSDRATNETLTYFKSIADQVNIPIILYSTHSAPLSTEVVEELASHPRIIGLVDEIVDGDRIVSLLGKTSQVKHEVTVTHIFTAVTGRMRAEEIAAKEMLVSANSLTDGGTAVAVTPQRPALKMRTKVVGFQILVANTARTLEGLKAGSVGAMPLFAAASPQACYEVLAAWKDGDLALAEEKQQRLENAIAQVESSLEIAGVRYASDLNGYFGGVPRLPVLPLTAEERQKVELAMAGIRN